WRPLFSIARSHRAKPISAWPNAQCPSSAAGSSMPYCRTMPGPTVCRRRQPAGADGRHLKNESRPLGRLFVMRHAARLILLSFLQAPQHVIKLIETAIADRQDAAALALVDAHGKTKRVRYAFFQCDQIGVLVAAA